VTVETVKQRSGPGREQRNGWRSLLRTKPVEELVGESGRGHEQGAELRRSMGLLQLILLSVGATLGTGIFVILGDAAPLAGPAVVLSFLLAAVTALFSALSYAELAGTIPVSGSSYSYAYATLGELAAWVSGWCLMAEYGVSVSAVAVGWGQYLNELGRSTLGFSLPAAIANPPGEGGVVNLTAIVVVAAAALLLMRGTSESAAVNTVMTLIKLAVMVFFCAVACTAFRAHNLRPFAPLGFAGISAAGATVFFSYIGFDAASTAGEEARNPKRDLPMAIIISLGIVTLVYAAVALAAVGVTPWKQLGGLQAPLASVLSDATGSTWPAAVLSFGAVIAIASVVLTVMYGQTRILFAMARDGLVPRVFDRVSPRTQTPVANTLIVAGFIAALAGFFPLGHLADAASIGTLAAFAIVNFGVLVLRRTRPDAPRSFRVPFYPLTPILGVCLCAWLMAKFDRVTWVAFVLWTVAGLAAYAAYGYRHSRLGQAAAAAATPDARTRGASGTR